MGTSDINAPAADNPDDLFLLCPDCGYDLRGATTDRCSECGLQIDPATLHQSGFPWAHRRKIGRIRAYIRTVWQITRNSRDLAHESGRPQEPADGRRFRWVTAAVLSLTLLAAWSWAVFNAGDLTFVAFPLPVIGAPSRTVTPPWISDLAVPWSAGATLPWMVPFCLVLLAVYLTGVQQAVFRVGSSPAVYQRRIGAIAHYTAAPLTLLLLSLTILALAALARAGWGQGPAVLALATLGSLLIPAALGLTLLRAGQWVARVQHTGFSTALFAALELLSAWLIGVTLILAGIPWCVGFLWIVFDSFR